MNIERNDMNASNPFVVESPEKLAPNELVDLFVEKFTKIEVLKERKHTFLWGSRGSGKSMMLRYLDPQCQTITHGSITKALERERFFAVYCPCKEGQLNKTDLKLLSEDARSVITEHMLILNVLDTLIDSMQRQFPQYHEEWSSFAEHVINLFDRASIASSKAEADITEDLSKKPLGWLRELVAIESRKLCKFLRDNALLSGRADYQGVTSGYHDFLLPCLKSLQKIPGLLSVAIFVLLDDADRLSDDQQRVLNTWVANRDQSTVCFKISAQHNEYRTFLTRGGGLIEQPHDYSEIDTDEVYTRSKSDYFNKVRLIAERRLKIYNVKTREIKEFLPPDPTEEALFQKIRLATEKEWEQSQGPGRKQDFMTRYAKARLFQRLKANKQRKSYAGFENLVHLSSGVVRDFLEPCYLMFDRCVEKGKDPQLIASIPPGVQNEIIFRYSEDFIILRFKKIRKDLPVEQWTVVDKLATLIESLGRLFYERLHDPDAREARLFSFTVHGTISSEIEEVLNLGLRYRYFQLRTYSTKEGGGRLKWYILNRLLCPVYKLDPTGFEGRISLTPEFLKIACENPGRFVQLRLKLSDAFPKSKIDFYLTEE